MHINSILKATAIATLGIGLYSFPIITTAIAIITLGSSACCCKQRALKPERVQVIREDNGASKSLQTTLTSSAPPTGIISSPSSAKNGETAAAKAAELSSSSEKTLILVTTPEGDPEQAFDPSSLIHRQLDSSHLKSTIERKEIKSVTLWHEALRHLTAKKTRLFICGHGDPTSVQLGSGDDSQLRDEDVTPEDFVNIEKELILDSCCTGGRDKLAAKLAKKALDRRVYAPDGVARNISIKPAGKRQIIAFSSHQTSISNPFKVKGSKNITTCYCETKKTVAKEALPIDLYILRQETNEAKALQFFCNSIFYKYQDVIFSSDVSEVCKQEYIGLCLQYTTKLIEQNQFETAKEMIEQAHLLLLSTMQDPIQEKKLEKLLLLLGAKLLEKEEYDLLAQLFYPTGASPERIIIEWCDAAKNHSEFISPASETVIDRQFPENLRRFLQMRFGQDRFYPLNYLPHLSENMAKSGYKVPLDALQSELEQAVLDDRIDIVSLLIDEWGDCLTPSALQPALQSAVWSPVHCQREKLILLLLKALLKVGDKEDWTSSFLNIAVYASILFGSPESLRQVYKNGKKKNNWGCNHLMQIMFYAARLDLVDIVDDIQTEYKWHSYQVREAMEIGSYLDRQIQRDKNLF